VADPVLANVRGAGLLALIALGRVRVADIPAMVQTRSSFDPDPATTALYDERFEQFTALYKQTKAIHRRLNRGRPT
jgi:xylulokinase